MKRYILFPISIILTYILFDESLRFISSANDVKVYCGILMLIFSIGIAAHLIKSLVNVIKSYKG